ncbi:hypothetical protein N657DRAFT_647749 [Parathielavia appendiculata]|uniref:RBR-type E3 ubiquitin transferase n=1 Tax=Parathielavia appendiculata TaxID=2587402 RepID=A0AAN6Z2G3_9PEZI|nr:hypothetical protein N657DRAFT_647749 [Parathielavia appendiculata]
MATGRECVVCAETKPAEAFPGAPLTSGCQHAPRSCIDCIATSIRGHIQAKILSDVPCPECAGTMSFETIQRYADAETCQRYDELCLHRLMQEDGSFVWCAAGCGSGQIHEGGTDQPIVKCAGCGSKTCFACKVPWHVGMTCAEWTKFEAPTGTSNETPTEILNRRAWELRASKATIERTTKPCPKCKWNIEKNGGCGHMTCSRCKYEFCWGCLRLWTGSQLCCGLWVRY